MSSFLSLISIESSTKTDILIEFLRSSPAFIALIITLITPFINKKLEIEKQHQEFIYKEKYKIYSKHFTCLHQFNQAIKNLAVTLNSINKNSDIDPKMKFNCINNAINEIDEAWLNIKQQEAMLWLLAPNNILDLRAKLLNKVSLLKKVAFKVKNKNEVSDADIKDIMNCSHDIQVPLGEYLQYYRKEVDEIIQKVNKTI